MSSAAAPTDIWLATAAVISQPSRRTLSCAICSSDVSRRAPSSVSAPATGVICPAKRPSSIARIARRWLSRANRSRSSRLKPHFSHISCAPRNCEISWSPYRSTHPPPFGEAPSSLTTAALAPIGTIAMFSTPAAMTRSCVPDITPCAAKCSACWDEPHCRSIVTPGTLCGRPAESHAVRAMSPACGPSCATHPMITSSTAEGSIPVRSTSSRRTCAPRSAGWTAASAPLRVPTGVRTAPTM